MEKDSRMLFGGIVLGVAFVIDLFGAGGAIVLVILLTIAGLFVCGLERFVMPLLGWLWERSRPVREWIGCLLIYPVLALVVFAIWISVAFRPRKGLPPPIFSEMFGYGRQAERRALLRRKEQARKCFLKLFDKEDWEAILNTIRGFALLPTVFYHVLFNHPSPREKKNILGVGSL